MRNTKLWSVLVLGTLIFSSVDCISTLCLHELYEIHESNPFLSVLLPCAVLFSLAKGVLVLGGLLILHQHKDKCFALVCAAIAFVVYLLVCVYHACILIYLIYK